MREIKMTAEYRGSPKRKRELSKEIVEPLDLCKKINPVQMSSKLILKSQKRYEAPIEDITIVAKQYALRDSSAEKEVREILEKDDRIVATPKTSRNILSGDVSTKNTRVFNKNDSNTEGFITKMDEILNDNPLLMYELKNDDSR